jgi:agmatine deiminase
MPGYTVIGINSNTTIDASGSLHCMSHTIGTTDPLLMVHQNLPDTKNTTVPYEVNARLQHRSGIKTATIYYTTDLSKPYVTADMTLTNAGTNTWTGNIPAFPAGTHVFYYLQAKSVSGKQQVRPMPAPKANFSFYVLGGATGIDEHELPFAMKPAYPNPSKGITCIPFYFDKKVNGSIKLLTITGVEVATIYEGTMEAGEKNYFINTMDLSAGAYLIAAETEEGRFVQKLMVR